jgi:hypothetical protein
LVAPSYCATSRQPSASSVPAFSRAGAAISSRGLRGSRNTRFGPSPQAPWLSRIRIRVPGARHRGAWTSSRSRDSIRICVLLSRYACCSRVGLGFGVRGRRGRASGPGHCADRWRVHGRRCLLPVERVDARSAVRATRHQAARVGHVGLREVEPQHGALGSDAGLRASDQVDRWACREGMAGNAAVDRKSTQPRPPKLRTIGYQALALIEVSDLAQDDREDRAELRLGQTQPKGPLREPGEWIGSVDPASTRRQSCSSGSGVVRRANPAAVENLARRRRAQKRSELPNPPRRGSAICGSFAKAR